MLIRLLRFIDEIKEAFPDSLILYTGDHSNLYGDLSNSSLVPRDYMSVNCIARPF